MNVSVDSWKFPSECTNDLFNYEIIMKLLTIIHYEMTLAKIIKINRSDDKIFQ